MKKHIELCSELYFSICLIVLVLPSSYKLSSFELRKKKKATQQRSFSVANEMALNQVLVYLERVYADNFVSKFWFTVSSSSQHHSKLTSNSFSEFVSQVCTNECKTKSFFSQINLIFYLL